MPSPSLHRFGGEGTPVLLLHGTGADPLDRRRRRVGPSPSSARRVDSAGEAKCQAPTLYAGDHDVDAAYSGEADFAPSEGALTESVVRVPSHTVASTSASTAEPASR